MKEKLKEVNDKRAALMQGGGPKEIQRQHERGKLTARERIDRFLDKGSFQEVDLWAKSRVTGFAIDKRLLPGDAVIAGYGEVDGRTVSLYAQDFTVLGGSLAATHARKVIKAMENALKMRVPLVQIIDSAGARLQDSLGSNWRETYHSLFYLNSTLSGVVPQVSLMMGPCVAGAAYSPILGDFVIMVRKTSHMYIAPPDLIKTVQFVETNEDEIGGADMHAQVSGCCDLVAKDDDDCLNKARELLSFLPSSNLESPPVVKTTDSPARRDEELLNIVPVDPRKSYDMHQVIQHLVDNSHFFEVKPAYARNMITGFARLDGQSIGIIANNPMHLAGSIDINAAQKEARFIRVCDAFNIPIIFLADTPAYLPGVDQERGGIIRHGAKVLYALTEATVPMITVYIRKGYGGAIVAMCSQPMGTDFAVAWPTEEIAPMSLEGAANIIFRTEIASAADPAEARRKKISELQETIGVPPFNAAYSQWVEDIIDPRDTRPVLIKMLKRLKNKRKERPWRKHGNIPL